jgi:serine/threonine protein kinase
MDVWLCSFNCFQSLTSTTMPIPAAPNLIGQLLMQRYLILEPLESGGFSQTYLAIDTESPDNVACVIKFMDAQLNSGLEFDHLSHLFEAEAYALGCLGANPAIDPSDRPTPQLMAYCRDRSQIYLVQELIEGDRLDAWMESAPQPRLKDVIDILHAVLLLLEPIHRQGIIHCDIKPSNLIRRKQDEKLILIDFGACCFSHHAGIMGASADRPNRPNRYEYALGTPGYMPEEQAAGMPQFNSDLYALGMMIIQILTGMPPTELARYPGTREWNWHEHIRKSLMHLELIPVLDQMVRIDYRDRYHTVTAAIAAVQSLIPPSTPARLPLFRLQTPRPETPNHANDATIGKRIHSGATTGPKAIHSLHPLG